MYVIYSMDETKRDDYREPQFWSNDNGWGSLESATVFTQAERHTLQLPGPHDGSRWATVVEAMHIFATWQKHYKGKDGRL